MENMKNKDREMRYKHMMQKLDAQRKDRVFNQVGTKPNSTTNRPAPEQGLLAGAAHRLLKGNQYKPPLAPSHLPQIPGLPERGP